MTDVFRLTADFGRSVVGITPPPKPTQLFPDRKRWALQAMREEVQEFEDATDIVDEVDALEDLIYFAAGRLAEMGVDGGAHFQLVHDANMKKVRGKLAKRPESRGFDAVKPEGWVGPEAAHRRLIQACSMHDHADMAPPYVSYDEGLRRLEASRRPQQHTPEVEAKRHPKLLLIGHARHGKDTVAELLRDRHGLSFKSSSLFAAERIIMPHFQLAGTPYGDAQTCYEDRVNHRKLWYDLISAYNRDDPTRLARGILTEHDLYVGLRAKREFNACRNAGLFDAVVWVDRSDHLPPEDASSCTVYPWMADFVIDNNGTLDDLVRRVDELAAAQGWSR